jgi:hypothetical protein
MLAFFCQLKTGLHASFMGINGSLWFGGRVLWNESLGFFCIHQTAGFLLIG